MCHYKSGVYACGHERRFPVHVEDWCAYAKHRGSACSDALCHPMQGYGVYLGSSCKSCRDHASTQACQRSSPASRGVLGQSSSVSGAKAAVEFGEAREHRSSPVEDPEEPSSGVRDLLPEDDVQSTSRLSLVASSQVWEQRQEKQSPQFVSTPPLGPKEWLEEKNKESLPLSTSPVIPPRPSLSLNVFFRDPDLAWPAPETKAAYIAAATRAGADPYTSRNWYAHAYGVFMNTSPSHQQREFQDSLGADLHEADLDQTPGKKEPREQKPEEPGQLSGIKTPPRPKVPFGMFFRDPDLKWPDPETQKAYLKCATEAGADYLTSKDWYRHLYDEFLFSPGRHEKRMSRKSTEAWLRKVISDKEAAEKDSP